jgi:hypothetical protein
MERLLEASIDSPNMLREYLERGAGDNRGWAEDPSWETDAGEDGSEATTAATQALIFQMFSSLDPIRRPWILKLRQIRHLLHLHRFARVVADTWLGDYNGLETPTSTPERSPPWWLWWYQVLILPLLLTKDGKQPRLIDTTTTARTKCRRLSEVAPLLPLANKRQKTAAASKDAIPTSSASSVATADNGSKQKPTPATAAVTTASRRKKTAWRIIARKGRPVFFVQHTAPPCIIISSCS